MRTVFDYPRTLAELRPRYYQMLPWGRRNVGKLVAVIVAAVVVLATSSVLVG